MEIFLIVLMPLFYLCIRRLYTKEGVTWSDWGLPLFWGFLYGIPVFLLQLSFSSYFSLKADLFSQYLYFFFNREGVLLYGILAPLFFLFRRRELALTSLRELSAYFAGYYFLVALVESTGPQRDVYSLILLPLIRLSYLSFFLTLLDTHLLRRKDRLWVYLYFLLPLPLLVFPLLAGTGRELLFYLSFLPFLAFSLVYYLRGSHKGMAG